MKTLLLFKKDWQFNDGYNFETLIQYHKNGYVFYFTPKASHEWLESSFVELSRKTFWNFDNYLFENANVDYEIITIA